MKTFVALLSFLLIFSLVALSVSHANEVGDSRNLTESIDIEELIEEQSKLTEPEYTYEYNGIEFFWKY
ncbi:hypothetical protein [Jeotgalibacillus soli]|uniref:Uncharacterized protein n=1 Tax=Jeotgalibacillus soli TaxID=889306 RepID=A0A0C2VMI1_9BACL|nr:hypothetical protein [Jeotgalibacillus soli]KIL45213.1 hypothetical protein KP78_27570 [Jeotgalibacillus soli]